MQNNDFDTEVMRRLELFPFLTPAFLQAMNDIGRYGHSKYGELPANRCHHADPERVRPGQLAAHAALHFDEYLEGLAHDHLGTLRHQLAAVAFNAMMEFHFAGLAEEQP